LDKGAKEWKGTKTEGRKASGHKDSIPHDTLAQIMGKWLSSFATDFEKKTLQY